MDGALDLGIEGERKTGSVCFVLSFQLTEHSRSGQYLRHLQPRRQNPLYSIPSNQRLGIRRFK